MKKLYFLVVLFLIAGIVYSQPQKISYQAVIRNGNGNVLQNQDITLQLDILQGSPSGNVVYSERHNVTTNQYGLINVFIGTGIINQGDFTSIDWSDGPYYLKTQVDIGNGMEELGTQELVSVPYSFFSGTSDTSRYSLSVSAAGNSGELQFNHNGSLDASPSLYWDITKERLGIGTNSPQGRVVIQQDPLSPDSFPLFEVKDKEGNSVFVIYRDSVHIYLREDSSKAIGSRGKFAVSGRVTTKGVSKPYLYVTSDSTRVYFDEGGSKAIGSRGGFAVSGRVTTKVGMSNDYFFVNDDSTRVYTSEGGGGFGVLNIDSSSNGLTTYTHLTPDNYFIGEDAGKNISSGLYNTAFGYKAGENISSGDNNVFLGYQAGQNNDVGIANVYIGNTAGRNLTTGYYNVFIGDSAGYNSTSNSVSNVFIGPSAGFNDSGYGNTFVGSEAGLSNTSGIFNAFYGNRAGWKNTTGSYNVYIGNACAGNKISGDNNTFIGEGAGGNNLYGSGNIFIGSSAGYNETGSNKLYIENSNSSSPLIYGEFDNNIVAVNGNFGAGTMSPTHRVHAVDTLPNSDNAAVYGVHAVTEGYGIGVQGEGKYIGVKGNVTGNTNYNIKGGYFDATNNGSGGAYGIYATVSSSGTGNHYAAYFEGDVHVNGTLSKSAGSFKIDDPRDPANKYLIHSFVESPDMKNVYDGVVTLDQNGRAVVKLPDYFQVLNKDYRYLLTPIGAPAPNLYIEQEIQNNQFVIAGGNPGQKVSWQVTGIRKDPYALAHPIVPEVEKKGNEKGKYLHPELYGKPKSMQIGFDDRK
jgi:hypothetical protein